jgi:ABC-type lipoprotein export system ATPase subunit
MIEIKSLEKTYTRGAELVRALKGIDMSVGRSEFISITGHSGSGKTTLLHILGCLDQPTKGIVSIDGITINGMSESDLVKIRRQKIGFVFQQFYLIPGLSVFENVTLPLLFGRIKKKNDEIISVLKLVGLQDKITRSPSQLSGGEMQRVAIARALINNPEVILADEPTGNLDTENSENIFELLKSLNSRGITIIMVTHNTDLAGRADRTIQLKDGRIR